MTCSIVAYCLRFTDFNNKVYLLVTGVGILAFSGILFAITHKIFVFRIICFIFNAVALGFCIRCWYVFRGFDNPLWLMLLVSLACLVYLLVFYALLFIPIIEKHFKIYIWVMLAITVIIYFILISVVETTFLSTFGYYLIIEFAFIFAMCADADAISELLFNITVSTYSVFIVAIIIAICMFAGDGFDLSIDGVGGDGSLDISSPKDKKVDTNVLVDNFLDKRDGF